MVAVVLGLLLAAALAGAALLGRRLAKLSKEHVALTERFRPVLDVEAERQRIVAQLAAERSQWDQAIGAMRAQYEQGQGAARQLQANIAALQAEFAALDEEANALHRHFHYRRLNLVNERKEYFTVEIDEIVAAVRSLHGEVQITKLAEAKEFRQSTSLRQEREHAKAAGLPTPGPPQVRQAVLVPA